MAFLQVDFFSETFGMSMNMNVILPQEIQVPNPVNGGRFPKPYPETIRCGSVALPLNGMRPKQGLPLSCRQCT